MDLSLLRRQAGQPAASILESVAFLLHGLLQHTPHRIRRLPLGGGGDVGVGVQGEPGAVVAQHAAHCLDVVPRNGPACRSLS